MPILKPPKPDHSLRPFDDGVGTLTRDGELAGHVATTIGTFWSPSSPFRWQWWVCYIVAWIDGSQEPSSEDYPPLFITVNEMKEGYFQVNGQGGKPDVRYDFAWLPEQEARAVLDQLGIDANSF